MARKSAATSSKQTKCPPRFETGVLVQTAYGVFSPEYPGVSFEGWLGTIEKVDRRRKRPRYLVRWSDETLRRMPRKTRQWLNEIDPSYHLMWMDEDDLERPAIEGAPAADATEPYDSWDRSEALDRKFERDWEQRDWGRWLEANLSFPFKAKRIEDEDDAYLTDIAAREPFRLGAKMLVLGIAGTDPARGQVLVEVKQGRFQGVVPLADIEALSKEDPNYWPIQEYAVRTAPER